jgi:hydroxymethylbilane synthase
MTHLRIATRQSALALWQANHVADLLRARFTDLTVSLVPITTTGDRIQDRPLSAVGGKGLFIKELEVALLAGDADMAVHSMKDMPGLLPERLIIGAVLPRADPRDAFVSNRFARFADLPINARIGTSSLRRQSILAAARPDLQMVPLRGNVDTRLKKLDDGEFDAIVLAAAGLIRLGLGTRITEALDTTLALPAVGQGIIGIECLEDGRVLNYLKPLNDVDTTDCLIAERAFSARLEGSCSSPIAGFAVLKQGQLELAGMVAHPNGRLVFRDHIKGRRQDAASLGHTLAERLLASGADSLLAELSAQTR